MAQSFSRPIGRGIVRDDVGEALSVDRAPLSHDEVAEDFFGLARGVEEKLPVIAVEGELPKEADGDPWLHARAPRGAGMPTRLPTRSANPRRVNQGDTAGRSSPLHCSVAN